MYLNQGFKNIMQFAHEVVGLCPLYGSIVKKCNLLTRSFFAQQDFKKSPHFQKYAMKLYAPFNVSLNYLMHEIM